MKKYTMTYILIDKEPIIELNIIKWAKWMEGNNRHVADTTINNRRISTVFLGVDHNFIGGNPILFESMTFPDCEIQERYSTWEEAEAGHNKIVQMVKLESEVLK